MTEAETMTKEATFELTALTAKQRRHVTRIQDSLMQHGFTLMKQITEPLKTRVKNACEDMDKLGIPKQEISFYVCLCAEAMGVNKDYLRRLIPSQYKNQAQREISLSRNHVDSSKNLPGRQMSAIPNIDSTPEVNGDEIEFQQPPPNPAIEANIKPKSTLHSISKREYEALKIELDKLTVENAQLKDRLEGALDIHALVAFATEESDEELGKKVRIMVQGDPRYLAYLKKLKANARAKAKKLKNKKGN